MRRGQKITGQMSDLSKREIALLFYCQMNAEQLIHSTIIKLKHFFLRLFRKFIGCIEFLEFLEQCTV